MQIKLNSHTLTLSTPAENSEFYHVIRTMPDGSVKIYTTTYKGEAIRTMRNLTHLILEQVLEETLS